MLRMTRLVGESILIGGIVRIKIIETRGRRVEVGIDAPKQIEVHRVCLQCDKPITDCQCRAGG